MSVVRLLRRDDNVLQVKGIDAIDGSPVIDIKPYVTAFFPQKEVRIPAWMENLTGEMSDCYE
jgi:tRNA (Thr-GGU) A37 N-methylase